jgi:hypothetical protein
VSKSVFIAFILWATFMAILIVGIATRDVYKHRKECHVQCN